MVRDERRRDRAAAGAVGVDHLLGGGAARRDIGATTRLHVHPLDIDVVLAGVRPEFFGVGGRDLVCEINTRGERFKVALPRLDLFSQFLQPQPFVFGLRKVGMRRGQRCRSLVKGRAVALVELGIGNRF